MQYQVAVYTDVGGTKGDVAKDSSGNDLAWDNATQYVAQPVLVKKHQLQQETLLVEAN